MAVIQHRRGTSTELAQQTPAAGEIFFETDTNRIKIGDGQTAYVDLNYLDNDIAITDVIDLTAQLAGKAALYHQHDIDDVGGLQEILDGKASLEHSQDIHNLERAGAIDGQVITWSDALGKWVPQGQAIAAGSFVGGTVTTEIQGPDGSASAAAYGFTADAGTGMHRGTDGSLRLTNGSVIGLSIDATGGVSIPQGLAISSLKPPAGNTSTNYFVSYDGSFYAIPSSGAYRDYGQQVLDDDISGFSSVAISDDGLRMVVGCHNDSAGNGGTIGPGKIKIYDFDDASGTWGLTQTIDGATFSPAVGSLTGEGLGERVAISGDGTVIAASTGNSTGGYSSGSKPIRVYELQNTGVWLERSNHPDQLHANCKEFALSKDGSRIAYNWLSDEPNALESWKVQTWSGTAWLDDGTGADLLSNVQALIYESVSFSNDGLTVAIGRQDESYTPSGGGSQVGVIRVFQKSGTTWSQVGANVTGDGSLGGLGKGVSVQSAGSDIIVASIEDDYYYYSRLGAVVIHHWDGAAWSQVNRFIPHLTYGITAGYLEYTAISSDGLQVAAFDPRWDNFGVDYMGLISIFKTDSISSPSYYLYRSLLSSHSASNTSATETWMAPKGFAITADFDRAAEISYDRNQSSGLPATGLFTSRFIPGPTVTLNSLTDVSEATPSQGNALVWNSTDSKWEPGEVDSLQSSWPAGPYTPGTVVAEIDRKLNGDAAWTATDSTAFVAFHPSGSQTFSVGPRVNGGDPTPTSVIDLDYGATPNSGSYWRITASSTSFNILDSGGLSAISINPSGPTTIGSNVSISQGNLTAQQTAGACFLYAGTTDSAVSGAFVYVAHTPTGGLNVDDGIGHVVYRATGPAGTHDCVSIRAYVDALPTNTGVPARLETMQTDDQGVLRFSEIVFSDYRRFNRIPGATSGGWGNSGAYPAYACRAFARVQNSGLGSSGTQASTFHLAENFSSITSLGTGSSTLAFEYPMPDEHYAVVIGTIAAYNNGAFQHNQICSVMNDSNTSASATYAARNQSATGFTLAHGHGNPGNYVFDLSVSNVSIAVFR